MPEPKPRIFSGGPVAEVPLVTPPLVTVIAQARFPISPELVEPASVPELHRRLRGRYPILREETTAVFPSPTPGTTEVAAERVMRFKDKAELWQVSVSQGFIALDTAAYTSRDDFCTRFEEVAAAVQEVAAPVIYDRLGIRYVNRFSGDDIQNLPSLVADPFLGLAALDLRPAEMVFSLTQSLLRSEDADLIARWGLVQAGMVADPSMPPLDGLSWILDIDAFQERKGDFLSKEIGSQVRQYADMAYKFFRAAATDELLTRAGGWSQ